MTESRFVPPNSVAYDDDFGEFIRPSLLTPRDTNKPDATFRGEQVAADGELFPLQMNFGEVD